MTEAEFTAEILSLCHQYGLLAHHCYNSRSCTGSGLPDLIIVGKHSILFAELKGDYSQRSPSQTTWAYAILAAGGRCALWRPGDLDHAENILRDL